VSIFSLCQLVTLTLLSVMSARWKVEESTLTQRTAQDLVHIIICYYFSSSLLFPYLLYPLVFSGLVVLSDVNKDWTHKDQDKDKDQSHKDKVKDVTYKDSKQNRSQAQHSFF